MRYVIHCIHGYGVYALLLCIGEVQQRVAFLLLGCEHLISVSLGGTQARPFFSGVVLVYVEAFHPQSLRTGRLAVHTVVPT